MKLIIEQEFLMDVDQAFAEDRSICIEFFWGDLISTLKTYSIQSSLDEALHRVKIFAQTVTLDEVQMNDFLSFLGDLVDFELDYIPQCFGLGMKFLFHYSDS